MNQVTNENANEELRATKRIERKIVISFYSILAGIVLFYLLLPYLTGVRFDPNKKPDFGSVNPESIELKLFGESPASFVLTNTAEFMALLREGRHVSAHKCSYRAQLTLRYSNGTNVAMYIRPGHTNTSYEYSHGGIFNFSRPAFLAALSAEGIDTNLIPVK